MLYVPVNIFQYVGKGLPGLNQYDAADKVSYTRTQPEIHLQFWAYGS